MVAISQLCACSLKIMASLAKLLMLSLIGLLIVGSTDHNTAATNTSISKALLLNRQQLSRQYSHFNNSNLCGSTPPQRNHSCSRSRTSDSCPTWFICSHRRSGKCQCGPSYNDDIRCDEKRMISAVLNCYCVTEANNEMYLGLCFYNCERPVTRKAYQTIYHDISNRSELNDYMCGRFNRVGIACGECKPGLSPFVLSYNLSCVKCPDSHKNWWKFILFGFIPLTLFYFFVVFFNINVTSSRLHGFILFSQALSTPALVRIVLLATENVPTMSSSVKLFEPFFSMWNLDPFRSVLPDFCLNVTTLEMFALDACIAMYPLVLILVSYFLIELYDRNIWCIVFIWKPFRFFFRHFRESWNPRTSVIDSFATFFLLSYVKVLSVSADLMLATHVYKLHSKRSQYRLYYAGNIEFLHSDHIPFAALAICMFVVIIVVPTLILICYPFRCFQKCLSYYQIQLHCLHAFVDSFQGCYKDGTEPGTYDLRWLSSYGLVLRFGICLVFALTLSSMYFIYIVILLIFMTIILINFQPYKSSVAHYTTIDASFLILLSLFSTTISGNNITDSTEQMYLGVFYALAVISCIIPIIYIAVIVLHWIYSRRKWGKVFLEKILHLMPSKNTS